MPGSLEALRACPAHPDPTVALLDGPRQWLELPRLRFEWAQEKDRAPREAVALLTSGVEQLEIHDEAHSGVGDRLIAVGPIAQGIALVVFVERADDLIRIISAFFACQQETRLLWQQGRT